MNSLFIQRLKNPEAYPHPVKPIQLIETHISWIFLTGTYAYKIKKPMDFGFLNFSTLEQRKFYCEEELKLNRLLAPAIYRDVVTITDDGGSGPRVNGAGPVIEYAVKMREFPQSLLFSELLKQKKLDAEKIDELAKCVAEFHQQAAPAHLESHFGTPERVHMPVMQNFDQIKPLLANENDLAQLARLRHWAESQYQQHGSLFQQRKQQGYIRDCHGDLHLKNIVYYQNTITLFDRIEFNDDFRWTDVIADIAFLAMDLSSEKQEVFARRLINTYFTHTQDYDGLALFSYYACYRAVVRAKISLLRLAQDGLHESEKKIIIKDYRNFIDLAEQYTQPTELFLAITHGLTGSGKSSLSRWLVEKSGAIQISSDVIRKKLFGLSVDAQTRSGLSQGIYSEEANQKTYQRLYELAEQIIRAGYSVIVDATFLKQTQRHGFRSLAQSWQANSNKSIAFCILSCKGSLTELASNITRRLKQTRRDPSEADLNVLHALKDKLEPISDLEKDYAVEVNINNFDEQTCLQALQKLIRFC